MKTPIARHRLFVLLVTCQICLLSPMATAQDSEGGAEAPGRVSGAFRSHPWQGMSLYGTRAAQPESFLEELRDPAFDTYVDLRLIGQAWNELDPALMTDVALQLAEGERILARPHRTLPAKEVLSLAARLAAEKNDTGALDRLVQAASRGADPDLAKQIEAARKLAGASRDTTFQMLLPVEDTTVDEFVATRQCWDDSLRARLTGQSRYIHAYSQLEERPDLMAGLSKAQRERLEQISSLSQQGMPDEPLMNEQVLSVFEQLGAGSRQTGPAYGPSVSVFGTPVTPFYESTPTGRRDDFGTPATDRFGWPESSPSVGISIPFGGPSRSIEDHLVDSSDSEPPLDEALRSDSRSWPNFPRPTVHYQVYVVRPGIAGPLRQLVGTFRNQSDALAAKRRVERQVSFASVQIVPTVRTR